VRAAARNIARADYGTLRKLAAALGVNTAVFTSKKSPGPGFAVALARLSRHERRCSARLEAARLCPLARGCIMSRCGMPVVDAQRRAKVCGGRAITERKLDGIAFTACADCAAYYDAGQERGGAYVARDLAIPLDAEALKYKADEAEHQRLGKKLRRGRKRGLL
jgi:hypothetical protein